MVAMVVIAIVVVGAVFIRVAMHLCCDCSKKNLKVTQCVMVETLCLSVCRTRGDTSPGNFKILHTKTSVQQDQLPGTVIMWGRWSR